jgi:hypothetical protein
MGVLLLLLLLMLMMLFAGSGQSVHATKRSK